MALFHLYTGDVGSGKSLYLAMLTYKLISQNKKTYKKYNLKRVVYSNIKFSKSFEDWAGDYLQYWTGIYEIPKMRHCDLIWDEMTADLDAYEYANIPKEIRRFLAQYRKRGVDIYGIAQKHKHILLRAREYVTNCYKIRKILGSPDPSATRPTIKFIWGLSLKWEIKNFLDDTEDAKLILGFPVPFLLRRKWIDVYDTTQDIQASDMPPLKHFVLRCDHPECNYTKVIHK